MQLLRKILFPFSMVFHLVTYLRNRLYDSGIFRSYEFPFPIIAVGNLSTGGTGKSPMVEYLIRLLETDYRIATLSRGYGRKSSGFVLADHKASSETLGDEPFQFHRKFPKITVAVDADRVQGVQTLLNLTPKPDVVLLDDAFQHRRLKAGFYILLTAFSDLYADDFLLPTGNLRESRSGAKRAQLIVVTKCPADLSASEQEKIRRRLKPRDDQQVFFSRIGYDEFVFSEESRLSLDEIRNRKKTVVAGIAKPRPFFNHISGPEDTLMEFPDHHDFSSTDTDRIAAGGNLIVTTEKDYGRLKPKMPGAALYYLPIKTELLSKADAFNKKVLDFVGSFR